MAFFLITNLVEVLFPIGICTESQRVHFKRDFNNCQGIHYGKLILNQRITLLKANYSENILHHSERFIMRGKSFLFPQN